MTVPVSIEFAVDSVGFVIVAVGVHMIGDCVLRVVATPVHHITHGHCDLLYIVGDLYMLEQCLDAQTESINPARFRCASVSSLSGTMSGECAAAA